MLIRADVILAGSGEILHRAGLRVEGGQITAVISSGDWPNRPDEPMIDLSGQLLSPGLINAHCHLDYSGMKEMVNVRGFAKWIQAINSLKRNFGSDDYLNAIHRGFKMLMDSGVTTVANVESFPELMPRMSPPPPSNVVVSRANRRAGPTSR